MSEEQAETREWYDRLLALHRTLNSASFDVEVSLVKIRGMRDIVGDVPRELLEELAYQTAVLQQVDAEIADIVAHIWRGVEETLELPSPSLSLESS